MTEHVAPEGASNPASGDAGSAEESRRGRRRAFFRRFMLVAHAVTAVTHVAPALALSAFVPAGTAAVVTLAVFAVTTVRLSTLVKEGRRPRIVTLFLDQPLLTHWCASLLATLLLVPALVVAALCRAAGLLASPVASSAGVTVYGFSLLVATWGVWVRRRFVQVSHVEVPIRGLAAALDGYRIAQITDIHIGNYDTRARGLEWAALVNRQGADLVAVTGDLVTAGTEFYQDVADVLGALRAPDGVFVSMGNHDQWNPDHLERLIEAAGPNVLRNEWVSVRRGDGALVVAGIDDRMTGKDDLERTLADRPAATPTVLLSHFPEFFGDAADRGVTLVLSGHTHGGQVAVPYMVRRASLSRLARQAAHGLHVRGDSRLYVNAGLGTTGPPVRLGVAPEIAVFVLRRA